MKKILILIFISVALVAVSQDNSNLFLSNGYFSPKKGDGDGTWRYGEARWLPIGDYRFQLGPYIMGLQLRSKIDDFKYIQNVFGVGLACNFTLRPGWNNEKFGWFNTGWKKVFSEGSISLPDGVFNNTQKDDLIFFSGGLLLRKVVLQGPFAQQKIVFEAQKSLKNKYKAYWNSFPLEEIPFGRNSVSLGLKNYMWPIYIDWRNEVFLMPYLGISYIERNKESFFGPSFGLSLAKGYQSKEILSLSYNPTFHKSGRVDIFEVTLNILNIFNFY